MEVSGSLCPGYFTSREGTPSTCWLGGWVGLRASLDVVEKRKIPASIGN